MTSQKRTNLNRHNGTCKREKPRSRALDKLCSNVQDETWLSIFNLNAQLHRLNNEVTS